MIHLETYDDKDSSRKANTPWPTTSKPPAGLLNPTHYIQAMVGQLPAFLTTKQKLEVLKKLGWYQGDVDAKWGDSAIAALKAAQKAYGLEADGLWGPRQIPRCTTPSVLTASCRTPRSRPPRRQRHQSANQQGRPRAMAH
ncbi:peptidoglycan-binding domain-containing protein [Nannocystis pusilla]|uniref:peptidoglycan-binding domain-containing protein n=1 Tax=Nannocystis pusilla TaxID=889268 RepID=UPI003B8078E8